MRAQLGEADAKVEVVRLASGAAVNDAIISGSIDVAMAGLTVLLNLSDKTAGQNAGQGHDGDRRLARSISTPPIRASNRSRISRTPTASP